VLPEGVHHWTATHPEWEGPVSAYAIDDGERLVLVDPIAVPDEVRALFGAHEVVSVLTSTWHERDAAALGFPVWAPAPDRPEEQLVPATRYGIGDRLFGMEAYPGREGELDLVLWHERLRAVIAGDTLIDLGEGLEIPASWLPDDVTVEQVAAGLRPLLDEPVEFVLPTHGAPTDRTALERALSA
jgi:glyoxylase-like metal-dependent hydrolase (beta-lactamase superfamily II)